MLGVCVVEKDAGMDWMQNAKYIPSPIHHVISLFPQVPHTAHCTQTQHMHHCVEPAQASVCFFSLGRASLCCKTVQITRKGK